MLENIIVLVFLFLAIMGMVTIIYYLMLKLVSPGKKVPYYVVIPLYKDSDAISQIRSAIEKRNMLGENNCEIFAVDCGLSLEILEYIERISSRNDRICIVSEEEVSNLLFRGLSELKAEEKNNIAL